MDKHFLNELIKWVVIACIVCLVLYMIYGVAAGRCLTGDFGQEINFCKAK